MLNYVWLALIALGIGAALATDVLDQSENKYRNGYQIPAIVQFESDSANTSPKKVKLLIDDEKFNRIYDEKIQKDLELSAVASYNEKDKRYTLFFKTDETYPKIWQEIAAGSGKKDDLSGSLRITGNEGSLKRGEIELERLSFTKMKDVTNSVLDYAGTAVNIALGLIGIMALWLGIMKVAEEAGLITIIAKALRPVTKFLFPDVPSDHPAMGSMIMNISANMLGLGNAATPFGLKAMEELDKLNPNKGTATNAMCTFLAINTAGLTLIPATAIAVRAAAGSSNPAIIIGTSVFGASCATIMAILSAKLFENFPLKKGDLKKKAKTGGKALAFLGGLLALILVLYFTGAFAALSSMFGSRGGEVFKSIIQIVSFLAIPFIIITFLLYGFFKKVKVYEKFVEGAKEGFNVAVRIIPYLVGMLAAIAIFRAGGAMDVLIFIISPITNLIGMPAEALPMALMRPLSGSGSLGVMAEIISVHGPDTFIGILVSTFFGSSETTFYVLAVYFGSVNINKTRHALPAGLLADIAGVLGALFIVKLLFG
ncbi:MAG TPA: nucleoside recognition domain-containing protein [Ignavibacteriales bacterium]|nr:nucleoside recognition domain-containing protein [Ignavibacteriales bacterium]